MMLSLAAVPALADAAGGKVVFEKACKGCHGAAGQGNPGLAKAMKVEMRHLGSKEVQAKSDAELKKAITAGTGKMKPVTSITPAQADDVVAYIRTLKQ
jgi:mono/diheme cytochrome c family protein